MDLENQANRVLRETFGHDEFRPGQKEVIDSLVAGQHVLAVAASSIAYPGKTPRRWPTSS